MNEFVTKEDVFLINWTEKGLRSAREDIGLSEKDMADLLGVTKTTVSHIENGMTNNPLTLFGYGVALERCYAAKMGYIPTFREVGTSRFVDYQMDEQ